MSRDELHNGSLIAADQREELGKLGWAAIDNAAFCIVQLKVTTAGPHTISNEKAGRRISGQHTGNAIPPLRDGEQSKRTSISSINELIERTANA